MSSLPTWVRSPWTLAGLAGLGALALTLRSARYTFGGDPVRAGVDRDPAKLQPAFARKVEKVFQGMRARGFEPMLWEGYRTPARAAELSVRGTGISDSLHANGIAVDVVDGALWAAGRDPWAASAAFWAALGQEYERQGITWGGRFSRGDRPHGQAIPVSMQAAFRSASPSEQTRMVA
jgi:hypothetical protein